MREIGDGVVDEELVVVFFGDGIGVMGSEMELLGGWGIEWLVRGFGEWLCELLDRGWFVLVIGVVGVEDVLEWGLGEKVVKVFRIVVIKRKKNEVVELGGIE